MSSRRVRFILLFGAIFIVLVIGVSLLMTYWPHQPTVAPLPSVQPTAPSGAVTAPGAATGSGLNTITVNPENVRDVIATLRRSDSYSRNIKVEDFYGNNQRAIINITAAVRDNATSMSIDNGWSKEYVIISGGKYYVWYDTDKSYLTGPSDAFGDQTVLADQYQRVLTYNDIVQLDRSSILEAGFVPYDGENCIYVKYVTTALKYTTICYISVENGLLTGAEQYDGSRLIYRLTSSGFNTAKPDQSVFNLPDGKNALSVP